MTRLWDKGAPLDERVLAYTAGDDHLLDNRLVRYDIAASIAHAEMLEEQGLLSAGDLAAIRDGAARHRRGARARAMAHHARAGGLPDGDRESADGAHRRRRRTPARRTLAQRPGAGRAAAVPARRGARRCMPAPSASRRRSMRWRRATARSCCPATPTCSRPCRARSRCGRSGFAAEIRDDAEGLQLAQRRDRQESARIRGRLRHAEPRRRAASRRAVVWASR